MGKYWKRAAYRAIADTLVTAKANPLRSIPFATVVAVVAVILSWVFIDLDEARSLLRKGTLILAATLITGTITFLIALLCMPHRMDAERQVEIDQLRQQIASDEHRREISDDLATLMGEGIDLRHKVKSAEAQAEWCRKHKLWQARVEAHLPSLSQAALMKFRRVSYGLKYRSDLHAETHQRNVIVLEAQIGCLQDLCDGIPIALKAVAREAARFGGGGTPKS